MNMKTQNLQNYCDKLDEYYHTFTGAGVSTYLPFSLAHFSGKGRVFVRPFNANARRSNSSTYHNSRISVCNSPNCGVNTNHCDVPTTDRANRQLFHKPSAPSIEPVHVMTYPRKKNKKSKAIIVPMVPMVAKVTGGTPLNAPSQPSPWLRRDAC